MDMSRAITCKQKFQAKTLALMVVLVYNNNEAGENMKYAILIVDLKNSKKMNSEKRINAQYKMKKAIDLLNSIFVHVQKYKVVFSLGDSVQGAFFSPNAALGYFDYLKTLLYPLNICGGIGYGDMFIDLDHYDSNMQDGPAYHNARHAVEISKERDLDIIYINTQTGIYVNELYKIIKKIESKGSNKRKDINNLVNLIYPYYTYKLDLTNYYQEIKSFILSNITNYDKINLDNFDISKLNLKKEYPNNGIILPDASLPQNLAQIIGSLLGTTRENIRQMIEVGEMNQIRNLKIICNRQLHMKGL